MLFRDVDFSMDSPIIERYAACANSDRSENESMVVKHSTKYKDTPLLSYNQDSLEESEFLRKVNEPMIEDRANDSLENTMQEHSLLANP